MLQCSAGTVAVGNELPHGRREATPATAFSQVAGVARFWFTVIAVRSRDAPEGIDGACLPVNCRCNTGEGTAIGLPLPGGVSGRQSPLAHGQSGMFEVGGEPSANAAAGFDRYVRRFWQLTSAPAPEARRYQ